MILVDTSVWADHFREALPALVSALGASNVAIHPFVIGELACGTLADRSRTLRNFSKLAKVQRASDQEVLTLIESHELMGRGIGLIDVHLLASTLLTPHTRLWTHDKRLGQVAKDLSIRYEPAPVEEG